MAVKQSIFRNAKQFFTLFWKEYQLHEVGKRNEFYIGSPGCDLGQLLTFRLIDSLSIQLWNTFL